MTDPPPTQAIDWEGRYRDGATGWERAGLNPSFTAWRESGALAPCRILVPAAGRSPEPVALAEAGFDVTLVDASPTAVATQRARLERLHVKAQVDPGGSAALEPAAPFDAIYDQTCLCALPPAIWPDYTARLHRWLRPGGALFILFMQSTPRRRPAIPLRPRPDAASCFPRRTGSGPRRCRATVAHSPGIAEQPAVLRQACRRRRGPMDGGFEPALQTRTQERAGQLHRLRPLRGGVPDARPGRHSTRPTRPASPPACWRSCAGRRRRRRPRAGRRFAPAAATASRPARTA